MLSKASLHFYKSAAMYEGSVFFLSLITVVTVCLIHPHRYEVVSNHDLISISLMTNF